jgi:hypothetical protein
VCFFEMGGKVYMLVASRKNIDIFRGEMVWRTVSAGILSVVNKRFDSVELSQYNNLRTVERTQKTL